MYSSDIAQAQLIPMPTWSSLIEPIPSAIPCLCQCTATNSARPHAYRALLVASWCAAVPSVPMREHFIPVLRVDDAPHMRDCLFLLPICASTNATPSAPCHARTGSGIGEAESVRTGSGFWTAGHESSHGNSGFSTSQLLHLASPQVNDSGNDSDDAETAAGSSNDGSGAPRVQRYLYESSRRRRSARCVRRRDYLRAKSPASTPRPSLAGAVEAQQFESGRWKLGECLGGACGGLQYLNG